ncbi:MAG: NADH-quinone oxidoreductase subunit L [Pseudomonadota bacterium]
MPTLLQGTIFATLVAWLLLPLALLGLAGWSARARSSRQSRRHWLVGQSMFIAAFVVSAIIGILLILDAFGLATGLPQAAAPLGLYPDGLAVWMALLISFLGVILLRFAESYLEGDRGKARFLPWCLVVLASVMLLVFTHHLIVMLIAWVSVSVALHHLLTLYPERREAQQAAWQKFLVSRLGDVALIVAIGLLYYHYGSFELPVLLAAAQNAQSGWVLETASLALAVAALCKCAQLPLHGWLMKVMEAPTPVSALLHAGVINLGGFIWLRLYPLFDGISLGHVVLVVVGGITAIVAVLTMLTQTSVKHALAWSTCAQMGFMLFEIGLGAYTLALAHLLAHSLYKAHSFLASGRTVKASSSPRLALANFRQRWLMVAGSGSLAAGILLVWPGLVSHHPVLGALLVIAVGASLLGVPAGLGFVQRMKLCLMAVALVPLYALLHSLLAPALVEPVAAFDPLTGILGGLVLALLVSLASVITFREDHPWVIRWRLHFSYGLYIDVVLQRWLARFKPQSLQVVTPSLSPSYAEGESS